MASSKYEFYFRFIEVDKKFAQNLEMVSVAGAMIVDKLIFICSSVSLANKNRLKLAKYLNER